jgi:hypothetical protein
MSNVSRVLDLVDKLDKQANEIKRLEHELGREERLTKFVLEFGESVDPEFRKKCLGAWDKERNATWNWASIVSNTSFKTKEQEIIDPDAKKPETRTFEYNPGMGKEE